MASVAGMEGDPPVLAMAELAVLLGVSRARVQQLTGRADFPAPLAYLSVGRVWDRSAVASWAAARGRSVRGGGGEPGS